MSEVLSELFPVIDVESPPPPELYKLGGTNLVMGSHEVTPGLGQLSAVDLFNPAGSGIIATVTGFLARSDVNQTIEIVTALTALATPGPSGFQRDVRAAAIGTSVCSFNGDTNAGLATPNYRIRATTNTNRHVLDPNGIVVLLPSSGIRFISETIDAVLLISLMWRERPVEPSEVDLV